jgi:N-acetylglucosamine-6-phosphate deacetylase
LISHFSQIITCPSGNRIIINTFSMKLTKLILCLIFFFTCFLTRAQQSIEGLLYLDNSPVRVEFAGGKITRVVRLEKLTSGNDRIYIAPGLIDNQVNGYMGISFVDTGNELDEGGIHKITSAFWREGVTTYLPTLTTNDHQIFLKNFTLLNRVKNEGYTRGSIAGFHLEGPYISPEDGHRGAHPLSHVRKPDWKEFSELYAASGGNILQVTLAPEIDGAMDFISKCKETGLKVGLGHHNGTSGQITEAIDRGAGIATHLGNGLANTINRHRNPLWPQLSDDRMMISIICDGFHLLPEQIRVFYRAKGKDKIIITSDVSHYGGMDPGLYLNSIGDTIQLTPEGAVIYPAQNVLSGSAAPLSKGVGHVMKVTGCDLAAAIQMTSTNPARFYGLDDRGEIKPGLRADLILFKLENFEMEVLKTVVAGEIVYDVMK